MTEFIATINSKNQITLPRDMRQRLGLKPGDKIAFALSDIGHVELRPIRHSLESVLGSIKALPGETPDLDQEIAAAIADETHER